jgi:hypothetical protein
MGVDWSSDSVFGSPCAQYGLVGRIFTPIFSASPLWSTSAKKADSFGLQNILQLFYCLIDRVSARPADDSFGFFSLMPVP